MKQQNSNFSSPLYHCFVTTRKNHMNRKLLDERQVKFSIIDFENNSSDLDEIVQKMRQRRKSTSIKKFWAQQLLFGIQSSFEDTADGT